MTQNICREIQSSSTDNRALAVFLTECFAATDHYCKNAVETIHDSLPELVDLSRDQLRDVRLLIGLPRLSMFDNVPYLRRFRVNGRIYIMSFV